MKSQGVKKLALALVATVIGLGVVEGFLRLTGRGIPRPEIQFGEIIGARLSSNVFVFDRDLFWREPSGPPDEFHAGTHFLRIGDEIPPKERRLRILCLGDSCTRLSSTNRPYSVRLQELMGPGVDVRNASLPGYTTHQGLAWLDRQLLDLEPDVVILYYGWNDHWRSWGMNDRAYARALEPGSLRLAGLLRPRPDPLPFRLTPDEYRENLAAMVERVRARGGRAVVVLAPHNINADNTRHYLNNGNITEQDDPEALHLAYLDVAREAAYASESALYDAAAQFAGIGRFEQTLMRDGIHPTDAGHQILAKSLAADILSRDLGISERPADPVALGLAALAQEVGFTGDWMGAGNLFRDAILKDEAFVEARLGLAWLLATCPDGSVRDGEEALALLEPIADLAGQAPYYGDIRAAALAESGRFEEAIAELDGVLATLSDQGQGDTPFFRALDERREGYRDGRPFRSSPPNPE